MQLEKNCAFQLKRCPFQLLCVQYRSRRRFLCSEVGSLRAVSTREVPPMKNAIRLSCFLLLLGALPGCTRENPPEYPPPAQTTDQAAPAPSDRAPTETVTRAPAPEPAPARPRAPRPSATDARPSEPAPAPARPVESVREREPVSPPPSTVSDSRPDRAEPLDRTPREPAVRMQTVPA